MAVERKTKNRRKLNEIHEKPTKEEYAVAKFLRFNVPVRQGKLVGMAVHCFFANKAVDALLESKWSASKMKKEPLFTNRGSCVAYCNRLLQKGLFHRAEKVQRSKDRDKSKRKKKLKEGEKEEESNEETLRERKKKEKKGRREGDGDKEEEEKEDGEKKEEKKPEKEEEKKKKEKKLRLNMSDDQWFVDGEEVYVWIYDPVPLKTFMIGLLMLFGAIALCLFPLWPEEVRIGVYYLSLAAAGFVGFILILVVGYLLYYTARSEARDGDWVLVQVGGDHLSVVLRDLTQDTTYYLKVQARNVKGFGPISNVVTYTVYQSGCIVPGCSRPTDPCKNNPCPKGSSCVSSGQRGAEYTCICSDGMPKQGCTVLA